MTVTNLEDLQEELRKEIVNFVDFTKPEVLKVANNSPISILGIKRPGVPNPFSSYLHGKLQQEAREHTEYSALSDIPYEMVDPAQENGLNPENISGRIVIGVEETYTASTFTYLQRLFSHNPIDVFYAVAKNPRLIHIETNSNLPRTQKIE